MVGVVGVLIAAGVLVYKFVPLGSVQSGGDVATYAVRRGDLPITVSESGNIQARESVDIKSQVEGRTTILTVVDEGEYLTKEDVEKGRLLVELDSSSLREQLSQKEIDYATAQASLTEAQESYAIQVKQNESDVKAAEMKVRFALMDLQKYVGESIADDLLAVSDPSREPGLDMIDPNGPADLLAAAGVENPSDNPGLASTTGQASTTGYVSTTDQVSATGQAAAVSVAALREEVELLSRDPNALSAASNLGGESLQKLRELRSAIDLADEKFKRDKNKLYWTKKLYEKKYVAGTDLEADRLALQQRVIEQESTKTALALFMRYEFPKQTETLLADYEEAQRELVRVKAKARSELAQRLAKLASEKARFGLQKDRKEKLEYQIGACAIKAPAEGLVVYASSSDLWSRRDAPIQPGTEVRERQTILLIPNTSEMAVETKVHETSVDLVRPGQPVRVTVDAFPDTHLRGKVLRVAPLPDPQRGWLNPDLKVYATKVSIEGTHDFLKPGMSAQVEIIVQQLHNVLYVPIQSVANRGGKKVCYVLSAGGAALREVETGAFSQNFIEISAGLDEGEAVLLQPPPLVSAEQGKQAGQDQADQQTTGLDGDALPGGALPMEGNPVGPPMVAPAGPGAPGMQPPQGAGPPAGAETTPESGQQPRRPRRPGGAEGAPSGAGARPGGRPGQRQSTPGAGQTQKP